MQNQEVEIILVEDNVHDAAMAIRALHKHNLADLLIHFENGADALDFIFGNGKYAGRNTSNTPKVIFLDLQMPKVNGIEFLDRIKSSLKTKAIPVVVLTASAEDPDIKRCYELGANSYIVKSVDYSIFSKTIVDAAKYWTIYNRAPN